MNETRDRDYRDPKELQQGDRVRIRNDGDGAAGTIGVVRSVYKSGRCCVDLPDGGFRNLKPEMLERVE